MRYAIIIPARYESSRFPGKPLADIAGKSLICRVWEKCSQATDAKDIYVATDDERIQKHCEEKGIQTIMTSSKCLTGTDRVYEASQKMDYHFFVNVQGDEPLILPEDIQRVANAHREAPHVTHCGMNEITSEDLINSPSVPKVVFSNNKRLLYMSRAPIPSTKKLECKLAYRQVCIYAFSPYVLEAFYNNGGKTHNEELEDIELLRLLDLGHEVRMVELENQSIAVDHIEDVKKVEDIIKEEENEE